MPFRALRRFDQKSNPSRRQIQNNLHAISPAIPTLINKCCALVIMKTHHPASLTEEDDAPRRHKDTKRSGKKLHLALLRVSVPLWLPPRLLRNEPTATPSLGVHGVLAVRLSAPNSKCAERTHVPFWVVVQFERRL